MNQQANEEKAGKSGYSKLILSLLYVIGFLVFFIGPLTTLLIGFFKGKKHLAYRILMWVSVLFILLHCVVLFALFLPSYRTAKLIVKNAELKSNTHAIQVVMERYRADHCVYPEDPHLVQSTGYLISSQLTNPFTDKPMELTSYDPDNYYGSIGYIPLVIEGHAFAYYIVTFGPQEIPGKDINGDGIPDHVLMVVQSGCDCKDLDCLPFDNEHTKLHKAFQIPPLEDAIKDLKWVWR